MSTNINSAKTGSSYQPMEAGTYPAVCCCVVDLGLQNTSFEGKEKETNQILLTWEFPEELMEYNGEMKPRWISRTYTFSANEKSRLRNDLKTWRGRDFTEQELADFDIVRILGAPCLITVTQTQKNGSTYANMSGVVKIPKGMTVGTPSKKMHFDMDNRETWSVFPELPEWVQNKINDSLTFKNWCIQIDRNGSVANFAPMGQGNGQDVFPHGPEAYSSDDDLPF